MEKPSEQSPGSNDDLLRLVVPIQDHLQGSASVLPILAGQLREVIQQTEKAALELIQQFMLISSRAKRQSSHVADILRHIEASGACMAEVRHAFDELESETDLLSSDIQGIITSLQFQDITRQRIEHVIEPLDQYGKRSEALLEALSGLNLKLQSQCNMLESLEKLYTMESEREILRKKQHNSQNQE